MLATQLLRASGSLTDREEELLGIVESSVRNLKQLVANGDSLDSVRPKPSEAAAERLVDQPDEAL